MVQATEMPPLANWLDIGEYQPIYGDIILWTGWFSCWTGVVSHYDDKRDEIKVIFGGVPILLFTMTEDEHIKNTSVLSLVMIKRSRPGVFSILQHSQVNNANVWYV